MGMGGHRRIDEIEWSRVDSWHWDGYESEANELCLGRGGAMNREKEMNGVDAIVDGDVFDDGRRRPLLLLFRSFVG